MGAGLPVHGAVEELESLVAELAAARLVMEGIGGVVFESQPTGVGASIQPRCEELWLHV